LKERGILFSGPLVRALLGGTKTQTRRRAKRLERWDQNPAFWRFNDSDLLTDSQLLARCPYGVPGDRLWVRETWHPCDGGAIYAVDYRDKQEAGVERWVSSLFMPRHESRITLEVTEVRVQRLQEISEEDAKAEGVTPAPFCRAGRRNGLEHLDSFETLWDQINGAKAPWSSNPWLWCVSFKRVEVR
jgi:hypothetical protein